MVHQWTFPLLYPNDPTAPLLDLPKYHGISLCLFPRHETLYRILTLWGALCHAWFGQRVAMFTRDEGDTLSRSRVTKIWRHLLNALLKSTPVKNSKLVSRYMIQLTLLILIHVQWVLSVFSNFYLFIYWQFIICLGWQVVNKFLLWSDNVCFRSSITPSFFSLRFYVSVCRMASYWYVNINSFTDLRNWYLHNTCMYTYNHVII